MIRSMGSKLNFALHLDHGDTVELCKSCVDTGFSSVMIDASHYPFEKNIEETRQVWNTPINTTSPSRRAGRAGRHRGRRGGGQVDLHPARRRGEVCQGHRVDSLAISIGTSHGAYKFKPAQCTRNAKGVLEPPPLRFDILEEIEKRIPASPSCCTGRPRSCSSTSR